MINYDNIKRVIRRFNRDIDVFKSSEDFIDCKVLLCNKDIFY